MPREIISNSDVQAAPSVNQDATSFKDRLVKLIPSEIITAYVTIQGLVSGNTNESADREKLLWIVLGLLFILTPIYLYFISNVRKWGQIIFTSIAFLIWGMAVSNSLSVTFLGYSSVFLSSILLVIYTLLIPLFYKG